MDDRAFAGNLLGTGRQPPQLVSKYHDTKLSAKKKPPNPTPPHTHTQTHPQWMHGNKFYLVKLSSSGSLSWSEVALIAPSIDHLSLSPTARASPPGSASETKRTNYIVPVFPVYTSHKRPKIHRSSLSQYGFTHPKI